MRKKISLLLSGVAAVCVSLFWLPGCIKDKVKESYGKDSLTVTYTIYTPVYTLKTTVLAGINGAPQPIAQPGQLYIKGSYIYLNDVNQGIHIIDNSNPANPVQVAFLNIPGNQNIAIRNNILYADMYTDLEAIDITNPTQVKIVGTISGTFPNRSSSTDTTIVVSSWLVHDTTYRIKASGDPLAPPTLYAIPGTVYYSDNAGAVPAAASYLSSSTGAGSTGTAGSTASMTLIGNYIYAIPESHSFDVISIADSSHPAIVQTVYMAGLDLETIFPLQDKLLLGSMEGVYVYSIYDPIHPTEIGQFSHGMACDPVIADSQYMYVTLRSGSYCGGASNELDILSVQNFPANTLLKRYSLTGPSGVCKDGSFLFVCDSNVVRVFDATDVLNLQSLAHLSVNRAHDVIAANHDLVVVSAGGLYQFDYTNPNQINQLSFIGTTK